MGARRWPAAPRCFYRAPRSSVSRPTFHVPLPLFDTHLDGTKYQLTHSRGKSRTKPAEDFEQLLGFSAGLYRDLSSKYVTSMFLMMPAEFKTHLLEKVPSKNFETTREWVVALKKEVDGVLLPMVRKRGHDPDAYLETAAAFLTGDRVLEDLDIEERLDAAIDRATKRLYQLKMARQLDHPRPPTLIDSKAPMQLDGPKTVVRK